MSAPERGARVLYAFDPPELNGADLRREPIELPQSERWQASFAKARHGVRLNGHMEHPEGAVVFQPACRALEGMSRTEWESSAPAPPMPDAGGPSPAAPRGNKNALRGGDQFRR